MKALVLLAFFVVCYGETMEFSVRHYPTMAECRAARVAWIPSWAEVWVSVGVSQCAG